MEWSKYWVVLLVESCCTKDLAFFSLHEYSNKSVKHARLGQTKSHTKQKITPMPNLQ